MIEAKNIARAPSLGSLSEVCGTWLLISSVVNWFKMVDEAHVTAWLCDPKSLELIEKIFLKSTTELKQEGRPPWARNSESTKTDGINLIEETNKNTHRKVSLWRQYKTEWGAYVERVGLWEQEETKGNKKIEKLASGVPIDLPSPYQAAAEVGTLSKEAIGTEGWNWRCRVHPSPEA